MFKKNSDKIQFISTIEGLNSIEECLPKPAKYFIPQWFKDIPSTDNMSVKVCPSFPDYFSQGYILPMWADTRLKSDGSTWSYETSLKGVIWEIHGNQQFLSYSDASVNGISTQVIFKPVSPWKIITPPGWSVLQLPLFYHFNKEWSVLPGILDTDIYHETNQQILYHGNGKEIEIKRGTPLVLYIPFKRSNKLKSTIRYKTKNDEIKFNRHEVGITSRFTPNGWYREQQRKRDKNI